MKKLGNQRATSPTSHNNWPFRAKRSTRSNSNSGGNRLEKRDFRLYFAPIEQNRLNGLGYTMPPNPLRAITCHYPHDQRPDNRHKNHENSQVIPRRRYQGSRPALEEQNIGKQANQPQ